MLSPLVDRKMGVTHYFRVAVSDAHGARYEVCRLRLLAMRLGLNTQFFILRNHLRAKQHQQSGDF